MVQALEFIYKETMQPQPDNSAIVTALAELMKAIGSEVMAMREGNIAFQQKLDFHDIVTAADFAAEKKLVQYVETYFPNDGVRGEEGANRVSQSGYEWIFDPIDGTSVYASGLPFFGISAGRTHDGKPDFGMIFFPAFGECFFATRGRGALVKKDDAEPILLKKFRDPDGLKESIVAIDINQGQQELLLALGKECRAVIGLASFTFQAMLVAKGQIAAHINTGASPFDLAAAILIAEEAGCVISRLDRKPIDLQDKRTPVIVAANEMILGRVLEIGNQ